MSIGWDVAKKALFSMDAERVHHHAMTWLRGVSRVCPVQLSPKDVARSTSLGRDLLGLHFPNPLGLAAGFDKNAEAVPAWHALGFGFIEVGTVTGLPQPGNPRPRLFRLPDDLALMNRMGFNNDGAEAVGARLADLRAAGRVAVPLGVNLGRSKVVSNQDAPKDYQRSFLATADVADYIVVNISSPNTPGLRELQTADEVARLLEPIMALNAKRALPRPVLLKIAPDLSDEAALTTATAALDAGAAGLIATNTTISRDGLKGPIPEGSGGISGRPVFARSTELLALLRRELGSKVTLIGAGGITDAQTAQAKLDAGADLLQVYTGFIYGGPRFVRRTLRGLLR